MKTLFLLLVILHFSCAISLLQCNATVASETCLVAPYNWVALPSDATTNTATVIQTLPFSINIMGIVYSGGWNLNTDGCMRINTPRYCAICPGMGTSGSVSYGVTGTSPNRMAIIQWLNAKKLIQAVVKEVILVKKITLKILGLTNFSQSKLRE